MIKHLNNCRVGVLLIMRQFERREYFLNDAILDWKFKWTALATQAQIVSS